MNKIERLQSRLDKEVQGVKATAKDDCVVLNGELADWDEVVKVGKIAAETGWFYGVINDVTLKGWTPKPIHAPHEVDQSLEGKKVDVLVIGGGVVGCAILRELSRYQLSCLLVDKEEDLAMVFYFRVRNIYQDKMLHVYAGNKEILKHPYTTLKPPEMERLVLSLDEESDIRFELEDLKK